MVEQTELIGVEELTELIEVEELVELIGVEELTRLLYADRVGKTRREKNRSVTINRTRAEEARIIETEIMRVVETISKKR